ncbi:inositol monophosphatase family protein [Lentzea sp. NPDC055074]
MHGEHAVVAAVSLPYMDLHYSAVTSKGAFVNGTKLAASRTKELHKSVVAIGDFAFGEGAAEKNLKRVALTAALAAQVERVRMFGSAAHDLVWLAEGRIDGAVILSNQTLDIAAGVLIAREAGVIVTDSSGTPHSATSAHTVAAAPGLADKLLALVQSSL